MSAQRGTQTSRTARAIRALRRALRRVAARTAAASAVPAGLLAVAVGMTLAALVLAPGVAAADPTTVRASALAPVRVLAQAPDPAASVDQVLTNIRNWIMGIAAGLATVFVTVGAVRYMAAGGDLGEVEKAKTAFRSAGYGYAIAILAPLAVSVLSGIVGA